MSSLNFKTTKAILSAALTLALLSLFFFNVVLTSAPEDSDLSRCYDIATKKDRMMKNMILRKIGLLEPSLNVSLPPNVGIEHDIFKALEKDLKERYHLTVTYYVLFPTRVEKSSNVLTLEFHSNQLPNIKMEEVTDARIHFYHASSIPEFTYRSMIPEDEPVDSETQSLDKAAFDEGWKNINIDIRVCTWRREANRVYKVELKCYRSNKPELCNPIPLSTDGNRYPYLVIKVYSEYSNETNYVDKDSENDSKQCNKKSMFVDMDYLDYSNWVFSPNYYRDGYCSGRCANEVEKRDSTGKKSCKPSKTSPLPFVYWQNNNIVARNLPIVEECSCSK